VLRKIEEKHLRYYCRQHGILVLTYDDGPGQRLTPQLLNIFKKDCVKATFFILGMRANQHPEILEQIKEAGHEIGFHGQNHINYWKVSPWKALRGFRIAHRTLAPAMRRNGIFRPPYGKLTVIQWFEIKRQKIQLGWWTFVSGDTYNKLQPIEHVVNAIEKNNGGVILLHDFDRDVRHVEYEKYVLELTQKLIKLANQNGLKIKKLGELVDEFYIN
jgi:peptidoglycan/xylan/chitin deacetylase (PgdA/CDA1 family)